MTVIMFIVLVTGHSAMVANYADRVIDYDHDHVSSTDYSYLGPYNILDN
jgi:hypothetical protein